MGTRRAPWWMFLIAISFCAYITLVAHQAFWGPLSETIETRFAADGMEVRHVPPRSLEEQAGVRAGDHILAVDGQVIRNTHDWLATRANAEAARPERWEIARQGQRLQLTLSWQHTVWYEWIGLSYLCVVTATFLLSLLIAFRRPDALTARIGAWLIATASIGFGAPNGWAATWRHLPAAAGVLLWIPQVSRLMLDGIFLTFFTIFPGKLFRARWPWILVWTPILLVLPWRIAAVYSVIYRPGHATDAPEWVSAVTVVRAVVYLAGSVVALAMNYRRLEDVNQRRRMRVLVAGTAVGLLGAFRHHCS
jgi:hypothetical protein